MLLPGENIIENEISSENMASVSSIVIQIGHELSSFSLLLSTVSLKWKHYVKYGLIFLSSEIEKGG